MSVGYCSTHFGIRTLPSAERLFKFSYADKPWYGNPNLSNFFYSINFLLRINDLPLLPLPPRNRQIITPGGRLYKSLNNFYNHYMSFNSDYL